MADQHRNHKPDPATRELPPEKFPRSEGGFGVPRESLKNLDDLLIDDLDNDPIYINIGPIHPMTHGTFRIFCKLNGETIEKAAIEIGFLHRGFEKITETKLYQQVIPYTDRLNYCSALINNFAYCKAVERMLGLTITERAQYIRVILMEIQRIMDHLICVAANLVDLGALTNYWYLFNAREKLNDILEILTGARLTYSFGRIGGLARDIPKGFEASVKAALKDVEKAVFDVTRLIQRNRIFLDRTIQVGVLSGEEAVSFGFTGPCLRASGVPYDLRKARPYYHYDEFEFDIPVGQSGDSYDRIFVRIEEIRQSIRILHQAIDRLPGGPINVDDKRVTLPPPDVAHGSIEGLINHFKLVIEGAKPVPGEIYDSLEAANGELGFYIVSDGSSHPYRIKVRPPCFYTMNTLKRLIEGRLIADLTAILPGLNVVAGELDR
jgi:NADH-quinone oxidoreductase subunit C/D